jgi:hypothetical protein
MNVDDDSRMYNTLRLYIREKMRSIALHCAPLRSLTPYVWPFDRPIVQVAIRFEYLALDKVRRTHRSAMILTSISGRDTKRRLK